MNKITGTYLSILFHFNFSSLTPILKGIVQSQNQVGGEFFLHDNQLLETRT